MQSIRRSFLVTALFGGVLFPFHPVNAQYSANYQTNIISGVTSNWVGDYIVGNTTFADALLIQNSGVLSNDNGYIGYEAGANNNTVLVSGTGSVWSDAAVVYVGDQGAGNSLVISNGGLVSCTYASVGGDGYNNGGDANTILVTGTGSVWSNQGVLVLGNSSSGNRLIIANGGQAYDGGARVGGTPGDDFNMVVVSGTGSVWNSGGIWLGWFGDFNQLIITNGGSVYGGLVNESSTNTVIVTGPGSALIGDPVSIGYTGLGNQLLISNGGLVSDTNASVGSYFFGAYSSALVTGSGSVWSNQNELDVGSDSFANQLAMASGGQVYDNHALVGGPAGSGSDEVLVTGSGSVWSNETQVIVGEQAPSNQVIIAAGGSVIASNIEVGISGSTDNQIAMNGGNLFVTSSGIGVLDLPGGTLTLSNGLITADSLLLTNGGNSIISFAAGTLNSGGTFVTNGETFVVGNGNSTAIFNLLGGVHSFANNLEISSNAFLTGCGTIEGNVVVDPGGTVVANCGGTLTFDGSVTNNGLMQAIDGTELEAYGTVVNNGTIDIITGSTNFHGGFINNGTVLDSKSVRIVQISISGTNVIVKCLSFVGHNFQLQDRNSLTTGSWTSIGSAQAGTNGVLTFTDVGGATNTQRFYRVDVFP